MTRRRRIGAEIVRGGGVSFRVYAPGRERVEVVIDRAGADQSAHGLVADEQTGYWSGVVSGLAAGARYRFRLSGDEGLYADPASRYQPEGPFGPSEVVDPATFAWTDCAFPGLRPERQILYELHVGTFTNEGTWRGAAQRLPHLVRLGITTVQMMPVAEFAGARGWGYDGVNLFAPYHHYGRPDDLRDFVDQAHRLGLGVVLDVVYNHFGPAGNFITKFAPTYLTTDATEWGEALNYDREGAAATRELVTENAAYWIDEFHLDGLRLDATQAMVDSSETHVVQEIGLAARRAAGGRSICLVAENEKQEAWLARPVEGSGEGAGAGLDALWNDDFHHSAVVALTGHREAYYSDYDGSAREWLAAARHGFLFQGQRYDWQDKPRGQSTRGLPAHTFVSCLENHDQVANYGIGRRLCHRCDPASFRAMTALLLLGPWTPMLFQGQEWNTDRIFTYFADHAPDLSGKIAEGRAAFLAQFPRYGSAAARAEFLDPGSPGTFERCRLDWDALARPAHDRAFRMHRDLLALRRRDRTLSGQGPGDTVVDGAALDRERLLLRFFGGAPRGAADRLLVVNLGVDYEPRSLSEPLSAPPPGRRWVVRWSSGHPRYGGDGARSARPRHALFFAGHTADLLIPRIAPTEDLSPRRKQGHEHREEEAPNP